MSSRPFEKARFRPAGDRGLLVEFGRGIDPATNARVRALSTALKESPLDGVIEFVPTYCALLIIYDPLLIIREELETALLKLAEEAASREWPPPRTIEIPVCYGGEHGPDIEDVGLRCRLSPLEVARLHAAVTYDVYMIGFSPGFPFLGGLDERLHTPRLPTPRTWVPGGSVGIANDQTGVYSVPSAGGWRLIGRTPLRLFDSARRDPFLVKAGDRVKFEPISPAWFERLKKKGTA